MNKFSTLTAALLLGCIAASAQDAGDKAFRLERNRVVYLTCDTVTVDPAFPADTLYWSASMLANSFNDAGMPLGGMDATDWNYQVAFRNNYTDPETGFTLNRGYYRGITLMEDKLSLYGSYMTLEGEEFDYSNGYKNLKKVILYFVPLPNAKCISHGYNFNHDRLPSNGGRVEAQYMNDDGTIKSNNAYRDAFIGTTLVSGGTPDDTQPDGWSYDEYYYTLTNSPLNYEALQDDAFLTGYNAALVTIDQPFKLSVDLSNTLRSTRYDDQLEDGKPTEFTKLAIDGITEAEMSYYFAEAADSNPTTDNAEADYTSATGYNAYTNKWGKKVNWSADTPIRVGIKRRLYLVGFALVCGTEGAQTEYVNIGDYNAIPTTFTTEPTAAFGNPVSGELPENPWADRLVGNGGQSAITTVNAAGTEAPAYNLQGQRVSPSQKGIVVKDGRKYVNQ